MSSTGGIRSIVQTMEGSVLAAALVAARGKPYQQRVRRADDTFRSGCFASCKRIRNWLLLLRHKAKHAGGCFCTVMVAEFHLKLRMFREMPG